MYELFTIWYYGYNHEILKATYDSTGYYWNLSAADNEIRILKKGSNNMVVWPKSSILKFCWQEVKTDE